MHTQKCKFRLKCTHTTLNFKDFKSEKTSAWWWKRWKGSARILTEDQFLKQSTSELLLLYHLLWQARKRISFQVDFFLQHFCGSPLFFTVPNLYWAGVCFFFFYLLTFFYLKIFNQDPILEEAVLKYARDNLALVKVPFLSFCWCSR